MNIVLYCKSIMPLNEGHASLYIRYGTTLSTPVVSPIRTVEWQFFAIFKVSFQTLYKIIDIIQKINLAIELTTIFTFPCRGISFMMIMRNMCPNLWPWLGVKINLALVILPNLYLWLWIKLNCSYDLIYSPLSKELNQG